jgi:hypothetical protein
MVPFCDFLNHECTDVNYYLHPDNLSKDQDEDDDHTSDGSDQS